MPEEKPLRFHDRHDAGQRLAAALKARAPEEPVVLALPRGGVPVAFEVARTLHAPLDVLLVQKIGAPGYEEFGIGAVVDGTQPQLVLNAEAVAALSVSPGYVDQECERQLGEIERRRRLYCGEAPAVDVHERSAILIDDGIATGATMLVALRALDKARPKRKIVAVPVAAPEVLAKLADAADEVICLSAPAGFRAVGQHYEDFTQTSDDEVIELLAAQRAAQVSQRQAEHAQ
ncbi:MAG TPA: phosphoribosyltransferase family protein [Steroidobacteraceae bacterium]|jgi:putative phosphoribosyl transferase